MFDVIGVVLSVIFMTLFGSLGAVCLKKTDLANGGRMVSLLKDKWTYIAGVFYIGCIILNIYVLRRLDYSIVLPLTSLTYVWTIVLSKLIFNETISLFKLLAIVLIVSGTVLVVL